MKQYEDIKRDILDGIDSVSTTEGSFADVVVSPISMELEKAYVELSNVASKLDVENLEGEELERFIYQRTGVIRKNGTKATGTVSIQALEGTIIPKDTLVSSISGLQYITQEELVFTKDATLEVKIIAENEGSKYNTKANTINNLPVSITGVVNINNTEDVKGGTNIETDESLLERYYEHIRTPATSGNKYHYVNWAKEVNGIGDALCIPLWNENGTVKVIIVDANKEVVNESLRKNTYDYIEENRPVGATVTVVSAVEKAINITANVAISNTFSIQTIQSSFETVIEKYRREIALKKQYVSLAMINNILFNVEGVADSSDLQLNQTTKNVELVIGEIPKFAIKLELVE